MNPSRPWQASLTHCNRVSVYNKSVMSAAASCYSNGSPRAGAVLLVPGGLSHFPH